MTSDATELLTQLNQRDEEELNKLIQTLELGEGATTIFAIAPEPSPTHPVIERFQQALQTITEPFQVEPFRYSDRAFYEFLYSSEKDDAGTKHRWVTSSNAGCQGHCLTLRAFVTQPNFALDQPQRACTNSLSPSSLSLTIGTSMSGKMAGKLG